MPVALDPPHIRRIETDRPDACVFEVSGHIGVADIENMYGLLDGACALHDEIDLLVIVHDYEGVDWSAAFKDATLAGKTRALRHVRRYAVVGGPGWMSAMIAFFKPFLPIEMKHFAAAEQHQAWAWIGTAPARE